MTRTLAGILPALALPSVLSLSAHADPDRKSATDLTAFSGKYTLNMDCSDECAVLTIHFRRLTEAERARGESDAWKADGNIEDHIRSNLVKFQGAGVTIEEDGSVRVWASCVRFTIDEKAKLLGFDGYDRIFERDR